MLTFYCPSSSFTIIRVLKKQPPNKQAKKQNKTKKQKQKNTPNQTNKQTNQVKTTKQKKTKSNKQTSKNQAAKPTGSQTQETRYKLMDKQANESPSKPFLLTQLPLNQHQFDTVSSTYAEVPRTQSCAYHVQHIERLSRTTYRVPRGTNRQLI